MHTSTSIMEHRKSRLSLLTLIITVVAATADPDPDPQHAYVFGYAPSSPYYGQYGPVPFHYRVNPFIRYPNVSPASIQPAINSFAEQANADASTRGTIRPGSDLGSIAQDVAKEDPFFEGQFIRDNAQAEKIIGGGGVAQGTFPGYAVLVYGYKPFCGGTLITRKHVLTAGHCISYIWDIFQGYMSGVRIFLNTRTISPLDSRTVVRSVSTYWRHPYYQLAPSQQFFMYDIAVLQLDFDVNRLPKIKLAGSDEENYMGDRLLVYGFGWTGPPNSTYNPDIPYATSNNLRKGTVNMVSNIDCANTYGFPELNNTMFICTDGADPCFGDGGTPLMDDWLQVGVSAYNTWTCNISTPAINTRVSLFKDWIRYVVDSEN